MPNALLLCLLVLAVALCGCQKGNSAPPAAPATQASSQPAATQKGPDDDLAVPGQAMVTTAPVRRPDAYQRNGKLEVGAVKGFCYVAGKLPELPAGGPWEFTGPGAIADPDKGELEYYQNLKVRKSADWYVAPGQPNAGRWGVNSAVILITDLKAGPRAPLNRPGFTATLGQITCERVGGYGLTNINFGPVGEKVLFGTVDAYPCQFAVTRAADGQEVFAGKATAYRDSALKPGERPDPRQFKPSLLASPALEEPGAYTITCKRHPWQRAYLHIVENPYVAESKDGLFQLDGVPIGRHTVRVWHPSWRPVKSVFEIEVAKNEATEIPVEFKLPPAATRAD